jgi:biopolymer transport protein ExbB
MNKKQDKSNSFSAKLASVVIPLALIIAWLIFEFVMGNPSNFEGNDTANHPIPGNYLGMVYKGGYVVPLLMTLLFLVVTFSVERFFVITKATGKESIDTFMNKVRTLLHKRDIDGCISACDKQEGSLANVIQAALNRYKIVENDRELDKEQKIAAIQEEVEEATTLELPALEKNLVYLSTISTVATLVALLGTVLGMIRAFAALATAGAPDSVALATGISEALINTALGIATSAIAIIMYNVFTTRIDKLTYSIDEAGYSIVQTFAASHSKKENA